MKTPPLAFTEDDFVSVIQGNKIETRRLVTLKGRTQEEVNELTSFYQDGDGNWIGHFGNTFGNLTELAEFTKAAYPKGSNKGIKSRLQIGDRAYLKEPTAIINLGDFKADVEYFWYKPEIRTKRLWEEDVNQICKRKSGINSKQNQMFMLKSFARYHVEITDVRIERLMDITEEGAIAEGIKSTYNTYDKKIWYWDYTKELFNTINPIHSYLSEIAYIHKPPKNSIGGWDLVNSNPWLWVYKFKFLGENL